MAKVFQAAGSEYGFTGAGSHVLEAQRVGSGVPTFTTPAGLLLPDHEGVYYALKQNDPPWHGARRVENLLPSSEDLTNPDWEASATVVVNDFQTVTISGTFAGGGSLRNFQGEPMEVGGVYVMRFQMRSDDPKPTNCWCLKSEEGNLVTITPTNDWLTYSITSDPVVGTGLVEAVFGNSGSPDNTFQLRHVQIEKVSGQSNQNPGEYIKTTTAPVTRYYGNANGNTVLANVVTEASGAPLDPQPSLYAAPALTNSVLNSADLTQAPWLNTGTPITTFDQVGLDGSPNSASRVEDDSATQSENRNQSVAIPNDSDTHTFEVYFKKDNDQTRFPKVDFAYFNGTFQQIQVQINTQTGALTQRNATGTFAFESSDAGLWWVVRCELANNATGNTNMLARIHPADSTVEGASENDATGSCVVGNVEFHEGKTIAQVRGSAPIITAGSAGSTVAVTGDFDVANHDNAQGAYYFEHTLFYSSAEADVTQNSILALGNSSQHILMHNANGFYQSANPLTNSGGAGWSSGDTNKVALAYSVADTSKEVNHNGVYGNAGGTPAWNTLTVLKLAGYDQFGPHLIRLIYRDDSNYEAAKAEIDRIMAGGIIDLPVVAVSGNRPDEKNRALTGGSGGNTDDLEIKWLQGKGATSDNINTAWQEYLAIVYPSGGGNFNTDLYNYLGSLGHTGALPERLFAFWSAQP